MKKLFLLIFLFFLLPVAALAQVSRFVPEEPVLTDEKQAELEEAFAPALESTFDQRKQLLVEGCQQAKEALSENSKYINDSVYLTDEQKKELLAAVDMTQNILTTYCAAVSAAQDSSDLIDANQALVQGLIANSEQIQKAVISVISIGVEETIDATEAYLEAAKLVAAGLEKCGQDLSGAENDIAEAEKKLKELEAGYNEIVADGQVLPDEYADMRKLAKLALEISQLTYDITIALDEAAAKCPLVE